MSAQRRFHGSSDVADSCAVPSVRLQHDTPALAKSCEILPVDRPFDLHRYRVVFPDRWQKLLKANFRTSAHIAVFFDVSDRTAQGWLEGSSKPTGPSAVLAVARIPGAIAALMGDDE